MKGGIDPGATSGALALLTEDLKLVEALDMPTLLNGKKQEVNAAELGKILRTWYSVSQGNLTIYLEAVHSMPAQGVSSVFGFGDSFGCIRGVCGALMIPLVRIQPQAWKKRCSLIGKPKDAARTLAQQYYPEAELNLKKHTGRADAILIARFGWLV
jgi:crossover junction endodeoxyribonuclease RuvC